MAKQSAQSQGFATFKKGKKSLKVDFYRWGPKDGKYTKELFYLEVESKVTRSVYKIPALSMDDLKKIIKVAEQCIKVADGEI